MVLADIGASQLFIIRSASFPEVAMVEEFPTLTLLYLISVHLAAEPVRVRATVAQPQAVFPGTLYNEHVLFPFEQFPKLRAMR